MAAVTCPAFEDYLRGDQCTENYAGVSPCFYIGLKKELTAPMALVDNEYATPAFQPGKGLYKIECKEDVNNISGESLKQNHGFKQTFNMTIDAVSKITSKLSRALNNNDFFIIVPDGEESQIMYSPDRRIKIDAGGVKTETGSAPADDRNTVIAATLEPVPFINMYVTAPEGGWDTLLASKAASMGA